jgi:hypothetical protein
MQEDRVPALVKLTVVYDPGRDEDAEGAAALFKCLGRGVCPQLKHFSIRNPSYTFLPWLADALVLRGEVVKEGLESFGFRDPPMYSVDISSEELEAALAKLVQAPCLSKLQKLELDGVALGSWAAAMYLNSILRMDHLKELRIVSSEKLDLSASWYDEYHAIDGGRGVEDLVTALAAGMYNTCIICLSIVPDVYSSLRGLCDRKGATAGDAVLLSDQCGRRDAKQAMQCYLSRGP